MLVTKDPAKKAFKLMFLACVNHWSRGHAYEIKASCPFVATEEHLAFWNGFKPLENCAGRYHQDNSYQTDIARVHEIPFTLLHELVDLYVEYPGLSAFLPALETGNSRTTDSMWSRVKRDDDSSHEVIELAPGLVAHVMAYINNVDPIAKEV
jgi:hypothetical protein